MQVDVDKETQSDLHSDNAETFPSLWHRCTAKLNAFSNSVAQVVLTLGILTALKVLLGFALFMVKREFDAHDSFTEGKFQEEDMFQYRWCVCPESTNRRTKGFMTSDSLCFECYSGNELISRRTRLMSTSIVSAYALGLLAVLPLIVAFVYRWCPKLLITVITVASYCGSVGLAAFTFALFCAVGWGIFSSLCVLGHAFQEKYMIEIKSYPDHFYLDLCTYGHLEQQLIGFLVCGMVLNAVTIAMLQLLQVHRRAELKQQREDEIIEGLEPLALAAIPAETFDSRMTGKARCSLLDGKDVGSFSSQCRVRRNGLQKPDLEEAEIIEDETSIFSTDDRSRWPRHALCSPDTVDDLSVASAEDPAELFVRPCDNLVELIVSRKQAAAPESCKQPMDSPEPNINDQSDVFEDFWTRGHKSAQSFHQIQGSGVPDTDEIQDMFSGPDGFSRPSSWVVKGEHKSLPAAPLQRPQPVPEPYDPLPAASPVAAKAVASGAPSPPTHLACMTQKAETTQALVESIHALPRMMEHKPPSSPTKEMQDKASVCSVDPPCVMTTGTVKRFSNPSKKANPTKEDNISVCSIEEPASPP